MVTGMGCSFYEWINVAESIAPTNRVILFHRPGLGLSEIGSEIRNTQAVVTELNEIIRKLNLAEPVILVGHSYGGLCVQHFAKEYPEKVAGIVLVDSTSVDLQELDDLDLPTLDEEDTDELWMQKCQTYSLMDQRELEKMLKPTLTDKQKLLPAHIQQRILDFQVNPSMYKAMYSEIKHWKQDAEVIKSLGEFPEIPLIVIGRDKDYNITLGMKEGLPESEIRILEEKWEELIVQQAQLNKCSELIIASEASHAIYMDRPDVVVGAIKRLE
nr:alpha/beta hydrolase [Paenibacillus bovis]